MATDTTFAPFEFQDADGNFVGIDVDILAAIAEDQGFKYELKSLGFDAAVQAVESGQADGVIAGMSITDERKQTFDFADAYYESGTSFAVLDSSDIQSLEDLEGKSVAVKTGTQGAELAAELADEYGFTVNTFDDSPNMYQDVVSGNSAAAVEDTPVMGYAISQGLELRMIGEKMSPAPYGFAVLKGQNPELVEMFNAGLENIKANGTYDEILAKYGADEGQSSSTTTATPASDKTYVIATDTTFAPFEFQDADGNFVGIDVDILAAIAEDQGFKYELKSLGFDAAVQAVESGQADGVIAGMSITDERKQTFDFADAYYESGTSFAVLDSSDIESLEDLEGKSVAVKTGTQGAALADELADEYGFTVNTFDDSPNMYQDVVSGNSAAAVEDTPVMGYAISQGLELRIIGDKLSPALYGFAVLKGQNPELVEMFNAGLENIKADGTYDEILTKYGANEGQSAETEEEPAAVEKDSFFAQITNNFPALMKGLGTTVYLAIISLVIATIAGIFLGLMRTSGNAILSGIATVYIDIIRGLPLLVMSFFIYFGIPSMFNITISSIVAGILTLSLNAAAYMGEIVRGGIQAIDLGQTEAARSLGLTKGQTMRRVILPQAVKVMVPSFINQFVITLKDTSILSVIGIVELTQTGRIIIARTYQSGSMWLIIGLMYIIIITILTKLSDYIERVYVKNKTSM
ncbi:ABC transporter permease subunit [Aerococcus agrisoli]|uniref:ABC transporter permease subunit n=1 Tax=Aerococcus agrisoli TaxID=2487350 RepID=A0A3N4GBK7_9LACT|nr:amino acid ABC transporter substrate-binding protein/permease [Aerococcus agrisoli]RPA59585.1 ABC transporter permease subunit [Aerococcus agrisoli]